MKKKIMLMLLIASMGTAMLSGCGSKASDDSAKNTETSVVSQETSAEQAGLATQEQVESVDSKVEAESLLLKGSSTLAPVITQMAENFKSENPTWDKLDSKFESTEIDIAISGGGSGTGVKSAIDGSASFGLVSRPVSEEEKSSIEGYQEFKLGTDALTISVNPENKLHEIQESISTDQLKKIFSGEYAYWDDVNSELDHEKIVLVTRDLGGGAHKVFAKKVMGDTDVSEDVIQAPSMGALVTKIIENKNAIGYASFGVVNQNEGKVSPLSIDGIEPTAENIISGDYKISRPLLVICGGELTEAQKAFIDYMTSEEGMKIVSELGFVAEK